MGGYAMVQMSEVDLRTIVVSRGNLFTIHPKLLAADV